MTVDPEKMKEGTCRIYTSPDGEKFAVCKENGKIKIFPVEN